MQRSKKLNEKPHQKCGCSQGVGLLAVSHNDCQHAVCCGCPQYPWWYHISLWFVQILSFLLAHQRIRKCPTIPIDHRAVIKKSGKVPTTKEKCLKRWCMQANSKPMSQWELPTRWCTTNLSSHFLRFIVGIFQLLETPISILSLIATNALKFVSVPGRCGPSLDWWWWFCATTCTESSRSEPHSTTKRQILKCRP